MSRYRIAHDTLIGGYSIQELKLNKRGTSRDWWRISNHKTLDEARAALAVLDH